MQRKDLMLYYRSIKRNKSIYAMSMEYVRLVNGEFQGYWNVKEESKCLFMP